MQSVLCLCCKRWLCKSQQIFIYKITIILQFLFFQMVTRTHTSRAWASLLCWTGRVHYIFPLQNKISNSPNQSTSFRFHYVGSWSYFLKHNSFLIPFIFFIISLSLSHRISYCNTSKGFECLSRYSFCVTFCFILFCTTPLLFCSVGLNGKFDLIHLPNNNSAGDLPHSNRVDL